MARLDLNLDAYRLAADILDRLRTLLRRHLQAALGSNWEADGIPGDPREFLLQRRARESSVKWHPTSGVDLLDFASFANLHDVIVAHPRLRDGFARLVPEPQTLRLRFLELDSVLNRLAFARPITDSDMELLLGFDERLRPLTGELLDADPAQRPANAERVAATAAGPGPAHWGEEPASWPPAFDLPPAPAPPINRSNPSPPPTPQPVPRPAEPPRTHPRQPAAVASTAARPAAGGPPARDAQTLAAPKEIEDALQRSDDRAVLTSLYFEITAIAEKIWADATAARSPVWECVRESAWYRDRFSTLRLRVVSDFYDLLRAVQERVATGVTRSELHEFLKEHNFAQLLMDLREFFKPLQSAIATKQ